MRTIETNSGPEAALVLAAAVVEADDLPSLADALSALVTAVAGADEAPGDVDAAVALGAAAARRLTELAEARADARFDAVVGIGNRRAFEETLDGLLRAGGRAWTLVLFDLDDFKRVNDELGHPAGDSTLRAVARTAARVARSDDLLFRVGGDEFALLVEGDVEAGATVARRVQAALARNRRAGVCTISAGVAAARAGSRPDELVAAADRALRTAKNRGKAATVLSID